MYKRAFNDYLYNITLPLSYRYGQTSLTQNKEMTQDKLLYLKTILDALAEVEMNGYIEEGGERINISRSDMPELLKAFDNPSDVKVTPIIAYGLENGLNTLSMLENVKEWIKASNSYVLSDVDYNEVLFDKPDYNKLKTYQKVLQQGAYPKNKIIKTDTYTGPERRKNPRTSVRKFEDDYLRLFDIITQKKVHNIREAHSLLAQLKDENVDDLIHVFSIKSDDISDVGKINKKIVAQLKVVKKIEDVCNFSRKLRSMTNA